METPSYKTQRVKAEAFRHPCFLHIQSENQERSSVSPLSSGPAQHGSCQPQAGPQEATSLGSQGSYRLSPGL